MPLPQALQAAIDSTVTPDTSGATVFDFESGNKTVTNGVEPAAVPDIDTSADNWLDKLMEGDNGDAAAAAAKADPAAPAAPDDELFVAPDADTDGFLFPDIKEDGMTEMKDIIAALEAKVNKGESDTAQQEALAAAMVKIKEKYGEVDDDLMTNFSDLFSTFRASFGSEFGEEMLKSQTANDAKIAALEAKLEKLSAGDQVIPDADVAPSNNYRDVMAEMIPNYQKITSSGQFKKLMATPMDGDNPEFTFNKKLGKLYSQRKTADIVKFFSSFESKYLSSDGGSGAVVDSGTSSSSQGGQSPKAALSPDRLRSIFKRVMSGELKVTEAEMLQLRTFAAKQAMK